MTCSLPSGSFRASPQRRRRWGLLPALICLFATSLSHAELVEVKLAALDPRGSDQVVLVLIDEEGKRMLPISVSPMQAQSIYRGQAGIHAPRPLTHELMISVLEALEVRLERVDIVDLRNNTYFAELSLRNGDHSVKVDARPSDGIALALRVDAPIYASRGLLLPLERDARPQVEGHPLLSSLGLHLQELTDELARFFEIPDHKGVLVAESASGSVAARSGLKRGDVIQHIGRKRVGTVTEAISALRAAREKGRSVELQIVRGGGRRALDLQW
ncbi:MAG: bifunctional nuclease domain-containing protein [Acidobacteriota bacterium]